MLGGTNGVSGRGCRKIKAILFLIVLALAFAMILPFAFAGPNGPDSYQIISTTTGPNIAAAQINAQAGNITELSINATSITKAWQGFYGNITGRITLDNANNWTLYDWRQITPSGKIYATRNDTGINWNQIACANSANITAEDTYLQNTGLPDAVNETFKYTSTSFYVGNTQVSNCPATYTYVNDTNQTSMFQEVLLVDNSKSAMIYTSLIEPRRVGFDNRSHDFQMIVGEKGRNGDTTATPYYFYVELN